MVLRRLLTNVSAEPSQWGRSEQVTSSLLTTVPCCVLLLINGIMLFALRSKEVFCVASRYVLLTNVLIGDTLQLMFGQLFYLIITFRVTMVFPACILLSMLANFCVYISPLTLALMSAERFVAVCLPLRHASVVTTRATELAIGAVWVIAICNWLVRILLCVQVPLEALWGLQVRQLCGLVMAQLWAISAQYDRAFTSTVFALAGVVVACSYVAVVLVARSASADRSLAGKVRSTLLLHLLQLVLSLGSTLYHPLFTALSSVLSGTLLTRLKNIFYILFVILPRCLSPLLYGLRDHSLRPVFLHHLCCGLVSPVRGHSPVVKPHPSST